MEFTSNHYPGAQLPGGEGLVLPAVSLKIEKMCSDFGEMHPVCVQLWVKISLECSFRNTKTFPWEAFFAGHVTFIEVSLFQETSRAPKNS